MNGLRLYDIDLQIEDVLNRLVNEETGEINEEAEKELESLEKQKIAKIFQIGLFLKNAEAYVDAVKAEEAKLRERRKSYEKRIEWLKRYLESHVPAGDKLEMANIRISWRKSESVEIDEGTDLESIHFTHPELVGLEYKPNRREIKEFIKNTGVSFDGVRIVEKNNIQIK